MWAVYAFLTAVLITAIPLIQEKRKANGGALALWVKILSGLLTLPFVIYVGLPEQAEFYILVAATAVLYSISDIIYFRNVPIVGSGVITRVLPASVMITFLLWFLVDPALFYSYAAQPYKSAAILCILLLFMFFASRVKQCAVTWSGVRAIWFVLFAACVGPIITKKSLDYIDPHFASFSYVCIQAFFMVVGMTASQLVYRSVSHADFISRHTVATAALIAGVSTPAIALKIMALDLADNPAYVAMICFSDSLLVLLYYKITGKRENANIAAGLGIVACAVALVLIKSL
jgi:hypothetical protein